MKRTRKPASICRTDIGIITKLVRVIDHERTGALIRQQRRLAKVSLRSIAKEMALSAAYISDLELGRRNWSEELINMWWTALEKLQRKGVK